MLIIIDQSVTTELARLMIDRRFLDCIDNLIIAQRKGTHVISATPKVMRDIANSFRLDATRGGVLRTIAARSYEQASLIAEVTDYAVVKAHDDSTVQRTIVAGRTVYSISFVYFSKFSTVCGSSLVAEDSTDVDIYIKSLQAYLHYRSHDLRMLGQSIRGIAGGGSSTSDQFRERAREAPSLAIVDSDRPYPAGSTGNTAMAVLRTAKLEFDSTISDVEILASHELENIIPPALVRDCVLAQDAPDFVSIVDKVCEQLLDGSEAVRYVDLRRGVRGWDAFKRSSPEECRYYLNIVQTNPITSPCHRAVCLTRDSCTCIYVEELGSGILARVAAKLGRISAQKTAEYLFGLQSPTRDLWLRIAKRIFSWACAARPMRA